MTPMHNNLTSQALLSSFPEALHEVTLTEVHRGDKLKGIMWFCVVKDEMEVL